MNNKELETRISNVVLRHITAASHHTMESPEVKELLTLYAMDRIQYSVLAAYANDYAAICNYDVWNGLMDMADLLVVEGGSAHE